MFDAVAGTRGILGESPVWSVAEQALYWIDVRAPELRRLDPATGAVDSWSLPDIVGSVMLRASGGLVLAMRTGLFAFEPTHDDAPRPLVPFDEGFEGNRLNDSKVDRAGRIWCSTMWDYGRHCTGSLYRVDSDLSVHRVRTDITIPNAISFSPDGRFISFADTPTRRLERAELDGAGVPGPWRLLDNGSAVPGNPDGATVDAEGALWNARYGGGAIVRFTPKGGVERIVLLKTVQPSACAFGGPDLSTLYVTTSRQGLTQGALEREPLAGCLLAGRVDAVGIAEPMFGG